MYVYLLVYGGSKATDCSAYSSGQKWKMSFARAHNDSVLHLL